MKKQKFQKLITEIRRMRESQDRLESRIKGFKSVLNSKQVAQLLQVSTRTLQTYRDQCEIPFIQFGREVRYRSEDIQRFLDDHHVKPRNWEGGRS